MYKKQKYILFAILLVLLVVAMVVIIVKNRTVSVAKTSDVDYHAENEPVAGERSDPGDPASWSVCRCTDGAGKITSG